MITISAFKWVPDLAKGQVRDLRVRWALEEAGLPSRAHWPPNSVISRRLRSADANVEMASRRSTM